MIRLAGKDDLEGLLRLYEHLHNNPFPEMSKTLSELWEKIVSDENHSIIVAEEDGKIVSSCVLVIILNLTHGQKPYALVENVVTHKDYRNRGLASACLDFAKKKACESGCYKIMLMTGSKEESTLNFYRRAGYNSEDKTAFIMWL